MGQIVIAAFRAKQGEEELKQVIADRLPLLSRLGLATDRANVAMRAANGTIIDMSELVLPPLTERICAALTCKAGCGAGAAALLISAHIAAGLCAGNIAPRIESQQLTTQGR